MTLTPEDTMGSVVGQEGGDEQEFGKAERDLSSQKWGKPAGFSVR